MAERKQLGLTRINLDRGDKPEGYLEAVVYTCHGLTEEDIDWDTVVPDLDGDVIPASAFEDGARVTISRWGHSAYEGDLPAGTGTLHVEGKLIVLRGQLNLETTSGRDAFEMIRQLGDRCEFSVGFDIQDAEIL